ncbi:MAG: MFS transporter [Bacteroidales bacterium]|nr:MFS transporter [Bacteroidales bacterium]
MSKRPKLSFWQIWNMSVGFLGIQFGFALQNANVSRIFETLGAKIETIPILWLAAPLTGLIIQPIIGHASDKTWGRFGRRRPYFLVGAILASLALFIMPSSPVLWIAAGMLWIMDASINVSMEPFRAFVGDMLPSEQRTTGFAMQSFFIGTGAFVASSLPYILTNWFNIPNTAATGEIPMSVKLSFYIGSVVFISAIIITVVSTKEYSPEQLEEFDNAEKEELEMGNLSDYEKINPPHLKYQIGVIGLILGILLSVFLFFIDVQKEVYVGSIGLIAFGILEIIAGYFQGYTNKAKGLVEVISDLNTMPSTMKQLSFVQFFSWFALFSMWIYTNRAVTSHIYGTTDPTSALYNEGANWVGFCFGIYNLFAALFAFLLIIFARLTSRKITHMIALIVGGVSFISIYFISNPNFLLISFLGIGLTWASILAMPYAILTGSLPSKKMGVYMGIFNFFIVIPQILAGSILGYLVGKVFHDEAIYALVLGGISLFIAAFLVLFVKDKR